MFRNCIDVQKFHVGNKYRKEIRENLGISDTDIVFVFVGRLVENKGALQLLKAFETAKDQVPNIKLMLIGGETYSSNAKTNHMRECLKIAERMQDKVIFTGYIPNDILPNYLATADVGCVPSVCEEACGLTALEMMASGLPIITTDAGGLKEYVPTGCKKVSVWRVGMQGDEIIPGLVSAVCSLAEDAQMRSDYGKVAEQAVWEFDIRKYLDAFGRYIER